MPGTEQVLSKYTGARWGWRWHGAGDKERDGWSLRPAGWAELWPTALSLTPRRQILGI